jgi:hypothetical protein
MSASKIAEAANFVWGLPSGQQLAGIGRNVSVRKRRTAEQEPLQTTDGETDGVVVLDKATEVTLEAIIPSSNASAADVAETLTYDSTVYLVQEVERSWERRGWAKITLTLKKWDAMTLTVPSSGTST